MKLWDEARVSRIEGELAELRREKQELRERLAEARGRFESSLDQIRRLESEVDELRRAPAGPVPFTGMESARGALANAEAEQEAVGTVDGFIKRMDEFWGGGLSVEKMLERGAMRGGREFPDEDESPEETG